MAASVRRATGRLLVASISTTLLSLAHAASDVSTTVASAVAAS
jgi:hypothetical protein